MLFSKYYPKHQKIVRLRKLLDLVVYGSSFVDAAIMIITIFSFMHLPTEVFLQQTAVMLTALVVITIVLGGALIFLQYYDSISARVFWMIDFFSGVYRRLTTRPLHYSYRHSLAGALALDALLNTLDFLIYVGRFVAIEMPLLLLKRRRNGHGARAARAARAAHHAVQTTEV